MDVTFGTRPVPTRCAHTGFQGQDGSKTGFLEHQIEIWCSRPFGLFCSVNDAVDALPCATCAYLNGGPLLTCAAFTGRLSRFP
jgi:hypothetical protein